MSATDPLDEHLRVQAVHEAKLRRITATLIRVIESTEDEQLG